MEIIRLIILLLVLSLFVSCKPEQKEEAEVAEVVKEKSVREISEEFLSKGYKTFDFVDETTKDTMLLQQYFIAFLKRGPNRSQNKAESDSLQALHLGHLGRMYKEGYADISGPFGMGIDRIGITIYNTPTLEIADSLANLDPMVEAGVGY